MAQMYIIFLNRTNLLQSMILTHGIKGGKTGKESLYVRQNTVTRPWRIPSTDTYSHLLICVRPTASAQHNRC